MKRIYASLLASTALISPVSAHELAAWLSEDPGAANAQFALQIDGQQQRAGLVTAQQSQGQTQGVYLTVAGDSHKISILQPNNGATLYVAYMTWDGNPIIQSVKVGPGNTVSVTVGQPAAAPPDEPQPPAAFYANYNKHALHYDFTQPLPANWLRGCPNGMDGSRPTDYYGYDDPSVGSDWYLNEWWWWGQQTCNIPQVTDPKYGNTALDLLWVVNQHDTLGTAIQTGSPDYNSATGRGRVTDFPNTSYFQARFRLDPPAATADGVFVTWATSGMDYAGPVGRLEFDVVEWAPWNPAGSDTIVHNFTPPYGEQSSQWLIAPGSAAWQNLDPGQYHTFGMLVATYGVGQFMYACSYIDDVLQSCQSVPPPFDLSARNFLILNNTCEWWDGDPTCGNRDGQVQHAYFTNVDVWTNEP